MQNKIKSFLVIFAHFAGVRPRTAELLAFGQQRGSFLKSAKPKKIEIDS